MTAWVIKTKFTDDQGRPLIGGSVHTYYAGTSLPQDTFSDPELTVPNTNPVKLDDTGSANIFLKGTYRVRVFDRKGKFVEEQDNVDQLATVAEVFKNKGGLNAANERIDALTSEVNSVKEKTLVVESIADLSTINNPKDGLRVYVKSYHSGLGKGGGYFTYDSSKAAINAGGIVINGWVRESVDEVTPLLFGAYGDGVTDDAAALNKAVNYASDNRELLIDRAYATSGKIESPNSLKIRSANGSIFWTGGALSQSSVLQVTQGKLIVTGSGLTIDGNNASSDLNSCLIMSTGEPASLQNVTLKNLPKGTAYRSARGYSNNIGVHGYGYFDNVNIYNCDQGMMVYGYNPGNDWWFNNTSPTEDSKCIITNCLIRVNTGFAYAINSFVDSVVTDSTIESYIGFYREFFDQVSRDWTASSGVSLDKNKIVLSSAGRITSKSLNLTVGESYFIALDVKSSIPFEIQDTSGETLATPNTSKRQIPVEFVATTPEIAISFNEPTTVQFGTGAVWKKSTVRNIVFNCGNTVISGTTYRGVQRGPTMGIESKNFTITDCRVYGVTTYGVQLDTEVAGSDPQPLYPDAYGLVSDTVAKFIGGRSIYSTCRRLTIDGYIFHYAVNGMFFNTKHEYSTNSDIQIRNIGAYASSPVVASVRGGILNVGGNIATDSNGQYLFTTEGDDPSTKVVFNNGAGNTPQVISEPYSYIRCSGNVFAVRNPNAEPLEVHLPTLTFRNEGLSITGTRLNNNPITLKTLTNKGSINTHLASSTTLVWPTDKRHCHITSVGDNNVYYISFS